MISVWVRGSVYELSLFQNENRKFRTTLFIRLRPQNLQLSKLNKVKTEIFMKLTEILKDNKSVRRTRLR